MAVFAGALGHRLATLSYRTCGQEIVIHNYFRTRRVLIAEIEGLDIGKASAGNLLTVRILTRGIAIPIDVVGITPGIFGRKTARATEQLDRRRQELANWLTSTPALSSASSRRPESS
jgi:hypothetical protein